MNYILTPFLVISACVLLHTQPDQSIYNSLQFGAAHSTHGTGDLHGISFDLSYEHGLSKRLDWSNGFSTTIHSGKDEQVNTTFFPPGLPPQTVEAPGENLLRFTTAGFQWTSVLNFNLIVVPNHKLRLGGGTVLRYESSSQPVGYGYTIDPAVSPLPEYTFNEYGNLHQMSVGFNFGLSYLATIGSNTILGVKVNFQNDTNGSAITHLGLVLGRRIPFAGKG